MVLAGPPLTGTFVARAQASDFACLRLVKHQLGRASD
jgi:hypothetical protein